MNFPAGPEAARVHPLRMGELTASKSANDVLSIVGLGSCVALVLIAREKQAAAMAHIVLPDSEMAIGREFPLGKFADTAVPEMLKQLRALRVKPEDLYAIVIGGSTMFSAKPESKLAGVGDRNTEAVIEQVAALGIPVACQDVGGNTGRSVQVYVHDGRVFSKSGVESPIELRPSRIPPHTEPKTVDASPSTLPFPSDIWATPPEGSVTA